MLVAEVADDATPDDAAVPAALFFFPAAMVVAAAEVDEADLCAFFPVAVATDAEVLAETGSETVLEAVDEDEEAEAVPEADTEEPEMMPATALDGVPSAVTSK